MKLYETEFFSKPMASYTQKARQKPVTRNVHPESLNTV